MFPVKKKKGERIQSERLQDEDNDTDRNKTYKQSIKMLLLWTADIVFAVLRGCCMGVVCHISQFATKAFYALGRR